MLNQWSHRQHVTRTRITLLGFNLSVVEEGGHTVVYTQRLYWRRSESGALKIVAEDRG